MILGSPIWAPAIGINIILQFVNSRKKIGRWIVNQTKSGPAITFETFRYEVEDWEESEPYTENSR